MGISSEMKQRARWFDFSAEKIKPIPNQQQMLLFLISLLCGEWTNVREMKQLRVGFN